MKVLVIFSLVALCYSTPITFQKRVTVTDDGTIKIKGHQGGEIDIYKSIIDPSKLNIIIKSPHGNARKIQVDETADIKNVDFNTLDARFFKSMPREQRTQANILVHIFREYEGLVDETTYKILLARIETLVKEGFLHEAILEALRTLDKLRTVEDVKNDEARDLMDNIVREKLAEDVEFPTTELRQLRKVSGVEPVEGTFGLNQFKTFLPNQRSFGAQELWHMQNWTPFKRQMLLQHIKQLQRGEDLGEETLPIEMLREQELNRDRTHQQLMQQIFQHQLRQTEMSPLNRYLFNMGILRGQGYNYPQQRYSQFQGPFQYRQHIPQQWEQLEQLKRWEQLEQLKKWEQLKELENYEHDRENLFQHEVFPQQFERFAEQGHFAPQETVFQRYGYVY